MAAAEGRAMLNAILHGKKHGTGLEGIDPEQEFAGSEDTLTATLFERLFYLPDELVGKILFDQRIWGEAASLPPTRVESALFWPRWQRQGDQTAIKPNDRTAILPDVVVKFADR